MSERIAARTKSPSTALFGYYVWCMIPLIAGILQAVLRSFSIRVLLCLLFLLGVELVTVLSLFRYGTALLHLQQQLDSFRSGAEISVLGGPFSETEEKLKAVQSAHAEAIRQAVTGERFKVELISNVSHDLRTPLTAILGYGELLEQQPMSEEGKLQLSRLNQKAGYMRDLVDSLFELTKVSSGVLEPKREAIDLIRLLEQTIGLFDDQLTAAGLQVKRQYAMREAVLNTDGAMLHQVFANLLGNAIKYALKGSRIYLEAAETDTDYRVRMVNTASYEMDFTAEEIVQRFARGDKARSTQGSGIGLAIAQTYTEAVGGAFRIVIDGDQFSAIVTLPKN
jgi:signal transduction histidine kinase